MSYSKTQNHQYFYQFKVSYQGTHYCGWQVQRHQVGRTIQGEIINSLAQLCQNQNLNKEIKIVGASRTDAGVHAFAQVFKAELPLKLPLSALTKGLNNLLPRDIQVIEAKLCSPEFRPIHDAYYKEYRYLFSLEDRLHPFYKDFVALCPYKNLNLELMQAAAKIFIGHHDFCNFYCVGTEVASTRRKIFECELSQGVSMGFLNSLTDHNDFYMFRVVGNGFLKQMVRLMVGCIWNIGRGKVSLDELRRGLLEKFPQKLGIVSPPEGLYLYNINYDDPLYSTAAVIINN